MSSPRREPPVNALTARQRAALVDAFARALLADLGLMVTEGGKAEAPRRSGEGNDGRAE